MGPFGKGAQGESGVEQPLRDSRLDGIIDETLGADVPGDSRAWRMQREAGPASEKRRAGDQQRLANTTFAGKKCLVVGGSRGLGRSEANRAPFDRRGRCRNSARSER